MLDFERVFDKNKLVTVSVELDETLCPENFMAQRYTVSGDLVKEACNRWGGGGLLVYS